MVKIKSSPTSQAGGRQQPQQGQLQRHHPERARQGQVIGQGKREANQQRIEGIGVEARVFSAAGRAIIELLLDFLQRLGAVWAPGVGHEVARRRPTGCEGAAPGRALNILRIKPAKPGNQYQRQDQEHRERKGKATIFQQEYCPERGSLPGRIIGVL
jgi:hypothetical protein